MMRQVLGSILLVLALAGCSLFSSDITPDQLVGKTVILTFESGAFPDSILTMQFVSSKDIVWKVTGNLGNITGSADYLVSMVSPDTMLLTWRSRVGKVTYIITMDFDAQRCFLVRPNGDENLMSEGVFAYE